MGHLPARIAWRYLFARKSHSAVRIITGVAVAGVAIATAAIVCVLSVFNGFREVLTGRLDSLAPDVVVTPAAGKTFAAADSLLHVLRGTEGMALATPVLADQALLLCAGRELPVTIKGIRPAEYTRIARLDTLLADGAPFTPCDPGATRLDDKADTYDIDGLDDGEGDWFDIQPEPAEALLSIGVASQLGSPSGTGLILFAPRRLGRVNLANPLNSFVRDTLVSRGIFRTDQSDYDNSLVFVDIAVARNIFQRPGEASAIEIAADPGADPARIAGRIRDRLGESYLVKDRFEQQDISFRMVSIEKWVTFMLLFFILLIASFNIVSSLTMLVLDKQRSLRALHALGMSRSAIASVFAWESIFVAGAGGVAGIALGVGLCLLQQRYGFIQLDAGTEDFIPQAYPVSVHISDLLATLVPVMLTGLLTAWISSRFARSRLRR